MAPLSVCGKPVHGLPFESSWSTGRYFAWDSDSHRPPAAGARSAGATRKASPRFVPSAAPGALDVAVTFVGARCFRTGVAGCFRACNQPRVANSARRGRQAGRQTTQMRSTRLVGDVVADPLDDVGHAAEPHVLAHPRHELGVGHAAELAVVRVDEGEDAGLRKIDATTRDACHASTSGRRGNARYGSRPWRPGSTTARVWAAHPWLLVYAVVVVAVLVARHRRDVHRRPAGAPVHPGPRRGSTSIT